jgi:prepilin-type N-terminal cleavage/methylation domain-containing protein
MKKEEKRRREKVMSKQKSLNNKGFSLVELIVVIAIMAVLVGVLAPNLIRFLGRADISADIQLADTVRSAISVTMLDPEVRAAATPGVPVVPASGAPLTVAFDATGFTGAFGTAVAETLGYTSVANMAAGVLAEISTTDSEAHAVVVNIYPGGAVEVILRGTNNGEGGTGTANDVAVGTPATAP